MTVSRETGGLRERLVRLYPALAGLPAPMLESDIARMSLIRLPAESLLFDEGQACAGFPLLLNGGIRVLRSDSAGHEIELYRVQPGEICIASTGALFGGTAMRARGFTTSACELLLASESTMMRWTAEPSARRFLLSLFADRLADLMGLIEEVAFHPLAGRLAGTLLGRGRILHCTHQQLADSLGTSREQVSRLLKRFEHEGLVELRREQITLLNADALRRLSSA